MSSFLFLLGIGLDQLALSSVMLINDSTSRFVSSLAIKLTISVSLCDRNAARLIEERLNTTFDLSDPNHDHLMALLDTFIEAITLRVRLPSLVCLIVGPQPFPSLRPTICFSLNPRAQSSRSW